MDFLTRREVQRLAGPLARAWNGSTFHDEPLDMSWPSPLGWVDSDSLDYHFAEHGHEVGARTEREYIRSARETKRVGDSFTYEHNGKPRVGYFHLRTGRLTILTEDETAIINHFVTTVEYVRSLPMSTYP